MRNLCELMKYLDEARRLRPWEGAEDCTGWEWHDRRRDTYGRFEGDDQQDRKCEQLHIRLKPHQAAFVHAKALANRQDLGTWVWDVIQAYYMLADVFADELADDTREQEGRVLFKERRMPW